MSQRETANAGWPRCSDRAGNVDRSAAETAVVMRVRVLQERIRRYSSAKSAKSVGQIYGAETIALSLIVQGDPSPGEPGLG